MTAAQMLGTVLVAAMASPIAVNAIDRFLDRAADVVIRGAK